VAKKRALDHHKAKSNNNKNNNISAAAAAAAGGQVGGCPTCLGGESVPHDAGSVLSFPSLSAGNVPRLVTVGSK
jgi:hypothetical protein